MAEVRLQIILLVAVQETEGPWKFETEQQAEVVKGLDNRQNP